MTAFVIPRKRHSTPARAAKGAAKAWTSMKVGGLTARTARKGVKAWTSWKVFKVVGGRAGRLLLVPVAVGGGIVAVRKLRSSDGGDTPTYGSPQGPAATPETVTPPKSAPGSTNGGDREPSAGDPPSPGSPPPGSSS
jgi:hypothetical protein